MDAERSTADEDIDFSLDVLARFYEEATARTARAVEFTNGDTAEVDVPNLAASLVPEYDDEARAVAHLLLGRSVDADEARRVIHDHASAYVLKLLGADS